MIARLRKLREVPLARFREDEDFQWLAECGLHLGCEIVLDVGNHRAREVAAWLATHEPGPPSHPGLRPHPPWPPDPP